MLEKDHFKKSSCIYGKVKSKADYLEIRFLPFTAVTPAGILGLHIVRAGREERSLPGGWCLSGLCLQPCTSLPPEVMVLGGHGWQCCLFPLQGFRGTALHS